MIAIAHVTLTRGEISSQSHLNDVAATVYPVLRNNPPQVNNAQGLQSYISSLANPNVYSCIPRPASQAVYLWLDTREFEVVIETFHHGHLLRSAESVANSTARRLQQLDMDAKIQISLQSPGDAQTYITGMPISIWPHIFDNLKNNIAALFIAIILVILAAVWLTDYLDDAIAGLISLALFTLWEGAVVWSRLQKNTFGWRIHDRENNGL